jgi:hypothetical protein
MLRTGCAMQISLVATTVTSGLISSVSGFIHDKTRYNYLVFVEKFWVTRALLVILLGPAKSHYRKRFRTINQMFCVGVLLERIQWAYFVCKQRNSIVSWLNSNSNLQDGSTKNQPSQSFHRCLTNT